MAGVSQERFFLGEYSFHFKQKEKLITFNCSYTLMAIIIVPGNVCVYFRELHVSGPFPTNIKFHQVWPPLLYAILLNILGRFVQPSGFSAHDAESAKYAPFLVSEAATLPSYYFRFYKLKKKYSTNINYVIGL